MKRFLILLSLLGIAYNGMSQSVSRVEPRSWFVGMSTPLQLMFYGTDLTGATVNVSGRGVTVEKVHNADSPNYIFVDVKVSPNAAAGQYIFTLKKGGKSIEVPYNFDARAKNSAARQGFDSKDVLYLLMPDRFAQGKLPDGLPKVEGVVDRGEHNARHGGNIQGMIDHLDYIADLGVTAIWSTPLTLDSELEASYHGYAASDYYLIDPRYGTNEMYREYVDAAHKKGLKIVQDLVPNHCGADHWWMTDLPFGDWVNYGTNYVQTRYSQHSQMDPHTSKADFINNRDGWFVRSMPDMNLRNPYVLNYLTQMAVWWAEWAGVDGFRVDTYPYNDKYAAAEWIKNINREYPKLKIVGECWLNEPAMVAYWEGSAKNRDGYSSALTNVMDFPLQQRINEAIGQPKAAWGQGAQLLYFILAQDYLYTNPNELLIFAENHDTDRLAHFTAGSAAKQMLVYSLLATMRGIAQLYYGSEQMMRGDQKFGHGGQRVDFVGGWSSDSRNLFTGIGRTAREDSIYQHTRRIFNWRKTSDAAQNGKMTHFFPEIADNLYVYGRHTDSELVFVVLNFSDEPQNVEWERYAELFVGRPQSGVDVVSGDNVTYGEPLTLKPYQSLVVEIKK